MLMTLPISFISSASNAWKVLMLFLIPVGGGIPAGVLVARSHNIGWPMMMVLYLISDIILAFLFEPLLLFAIFAAKHSAFLHRVNEAFRKSVRKTTSHYGSGLGPLAVIMVAFGVDPMTGRTAAVAAGHGFVMGWMLAIAGDMLFFTVLMVSTLWLNSVLGDGTWTTVVILVVMMIVPLVVRRFRVRGQEQGAFSQR
jgi:hypothetical protein